MVESDEVSRVRECSRGDADAWRSLIDRHHDALKRIAYRILLNDDDAEDAVQEAWIRIAHGIRRFDGRSSFQTWAVRIVIRQAVTVARNRRRLRSLDALDRADTIERVGLLGDPDDGVIDRDLRLDLDEALKRLTEDERAAVVLHFVEGRTFPEMNKILGETTRAISYRTYRGIWKIQKWLEGDGREDR